MRKSGGMPAAILFDLDDTILIDDPATRATFHAVAEIGANEAGIDASALASNAQARCVALWKEGRMYPFCHSIGIHAYECMWGNFAGPDAQYEALHAWCPAFREGVWREALAALGAVNDDLAVRLGAHYPKERRKRLNLMPDALEIVRGFREKMPVALLTNGAPSLQREKIDTLNLAPEFDVITISGELGIGKPKPEIFLKTAEKLGVAAADCVMVGNSLERDIAGGNGAGMRTVFLSIPGAREEGAGTPDATISALSELPAAIDAL